MCLGEPVAGIDPVSRRSFWDLVDRNRKELPSMDVVVATVYFEGAQGFHWPIAMDGGEVLAVGMR